MKWIHETPAIKRLRYQVCMIDSRLAKISEELTKAVDDENGELDTVLDAEYLDIELSG